ncbi:MAG TPA: hypothetical protein VF138_01395 [Caulobacteraceae bacterium]
MTAPAPWSVKGIDPRAREVAKELARREGVTLGEWLNRMITEQREVPAEAPPPRFVHTEPADPIPLEPSVRGLLGRVERGEREQIAVAARFEGLAEELRHDQMRLAERLRRMEQNGDTFGAGEALKALEQTVSRLAGHVYDGEGRTNDAIRDLGTCFVKLDGRLRRVEGGDGAGLTGALEQVRAEMATLADNVDRRLAKADAVHAQAMEKLGAEVARISERLAERIANAERRGAMAIDDVTDQVGRVAERIHQRQERAAEDVADRFRQSEDRTARLLEEMRAQIDASFAAARTATPHTYDATAPLTETPSFEDVDIPVLSTREVIEQARTRSGVEAVTKPARSEGGFHLFSPRKGKPKKGGGSTTLQTALFVTGAAAALGAGVASYRLGVAEPPTSPVHVPGETSQPRVAVALNPQPAAKPDAAKPELADAAALYAQAARKLQAGDASGLGELKQAAAMGHPAAQLHLARLYETGTGGLKKDEAEARRWTEQAARGGEAKAMHNLALYYFQGVGGAKDPATAALWFRQAAERGVTDSQYNLGRLYEEGYGVSKDTATAYRWYLIAARTGDAEARASADRMKAVLSPDARSAAEASASQFH